MAVSMEPWTPASTPGCNWSERGGVISSAPAASLWPPPSTQPSTSLLAPAPLGAVSAPLAEHHSQDPVWGRGKSWHLLISSVTTSVPQLALLAIFKSWSHTPLLWDWQPPVFFFKSLYCPSSLWLFLFFSPVPFILHLNFLCLSLLSYISRGEMS